MMHTIKNSLDTEPILKYSFLLIKWIFIIVYSATAWIILFIFYSLVGSTDIPFSSRNTTEGNKPCWGNESGNCADHILGDIHQKPYWD